MHDLATLGEVLLRLSAPSPARFETARELDVQIGGAEANVAATVARLGLRAAWVSALPANAWGERVRRELVGHGVDCRYVAMKEQARLGTLFVEYGVPPRPVRILYDRKESAFARLDPTEVDWEPVRRARLVHLTGITPALGPSPRALFSEAWRAASALSFDVNYRASLWSPADAREFIAPLLASLRYLFVGQTEAATIFELGSSAERTVETLARLAPNATVTLMRGEAGSLTFDNGQMYEPSRRYPVTVVDVVGAGDAYAGGFLWATLSGRPIQEAVDIATAVAALKCSMWGDIPLITPRDVEDLLAGGPDVRR